MSRARQVVAARGGDRGPLICLGVLATISAVLILALDSHLNFLGDDWFLLVSRRGWSPDVFLDPVSENIVFGSAVVYRVLESVFGLGSAFPYYLVSTLTFIASAGVLFVYVRRRLGGWAALIAAALILSLGAAFEDFFFAFQLCYYGSVAAGLGMLLALDRDDNAGDSLACSMLVLSLVFSNLGIAFAVGALVEMWMNPRPARRRLFLVAVPLGLFALWWLGWGHKGESHVSLYNLGESPEFVLRSAAAGFTSLLGLATGDGSEPSQPNLIWGEILVVGAAVGVALRIKQLGRCPRGLAVVLAVAGSLWFLTALNRADFRLPTSSRYQYIFAVLLLLILAETLRGMRIPRGALVAAGALTLASAVGGIALLEQEYAARWVPARRSLSSTLGALEIAGSSGDPSYPVNLSSDVTVSLGEYLDAVDADGSPGYSPDELAASADEYRANADLTLAGAEGLALAPPPPGTPRTCQVISGADAGSGGYALPPGAYRIANQGSAEGNVVLGRFGDGFPVDLGPVPASLTTSLYIPPDRSSRPWRLSVLGTGTMQICPLVSS